MRVLDRVLITKTTQQIGCYYTPQKHKKHEQFRHNINSSPIHWLHNRIFQRTYKTTDIRCRNSNRSVASNMLLSGYSRKNTSIYRMEYNIVQYFGIYSDNSCYNIDIQDMRLVVIDTVKSHIPWIYRQNIGWTVLLCNNMLACCGHCKRCRQVHARI